MKLYLIRHAEPIGAGLLLGRSDPPLVRAAVLPEIDVEAVYASPRRRAQETALAIDAPCHTIADLAEIDFGEWDGLSWQAAVRRNPIVAARKLKNFLGITPPGGEPWHEFVARVTRAWNEVRAAAHQRVAIVAHRGTNAVIAQLLTGIGPLEFHQGYAEVHEFEV